MTQRPSPLYTLLLLFGMLLPTLMIAGCGEEEAPRGEVPRYKFEILVTTMTVQKQPIPGLPVKVNDKIMGYTDKDGRFRAIIKEQPLADKLVRVEVAKSPEWTFQSDAFIDAELKADRLPEDPLKLITEPIYLNVTAKNSVNEYLFWVKAVCKGDAKESDCADIPVKVGDEVVATTNDQGRANFVYTKAPNQEVKVSLETNRSGIELSPSNPSYDITTPENPEIFVIEEEFLLVSAPEPAAKTTKRRKKKKTVRRKPRRKKTVKRRAPKRKAKKKKARKKNSNAPGSRDNPIELF